MARENIGRPPRVRHVESHHPTIRERVRPKQEMKASGVVDGDAPFIQAPVLSIFCLLFILNPLADGFGGNRRLGRGYRKNGVAGA